jgi:hypothetical protein
MTQSNHVDFLNDAVLGESSNKLHLHGVSECRVAAINLAAQARRSIYIFSYDLDSQIYNQSDFLDAVKDLAILSEHSRIKVLLQNNEKAQREGHRLVHLWRRLTSKIEVRRPPADYIDHPENFLLVDEIGYLHRKLHSDYEAIVDFNSRLEANKLSIFFNEIWEQSEPDSELRSLHI